MIIPAIHDLIEGARYDALGIIFKISATPCSSNNSAPFSALICPFYHAAFWRAPNGDGGEVSQLAIDKLGADNPRMRDCSTTGPFVPELGE